MQLKLRLLDSLACAIGAPGGELIMMLREHIDAMGGNPLCMTIGGDITAPDRAAP